MNLEDKIYGEKIFLREMRESDISKKFMSWLHDPEVNEFLEVRHSLPTLETQQMYVRECTASESKIYLGIFTLSEELIGSVTLNSYEINKIEIGLMIGEKSCQGQGIGAEVVRIVSDWVAKQNFREITAGYLEGNKRSAKLFDGLGFQIVQVVSKSDIMGQQSSVVRTSLLLKV